MGPIELDRGTEVVVNCAPLPTPPRPLNLLAGCVQGCIPIRLGLGRVAGILLLPATWKSPARVCLPRRFWSCQGKQGG